MSLASSSRSVAATVMSYLEFARWRNGDAGGSDIPASLAVAEGDLSVRAFASDGLFGGVVGIALDLEAERPARIKTGHEPRLQRRLARIGLVVRQDRVEQDGVRLRRRRIG